MIPLVLIALWYFGGLAFTLYEMSYDFDVTPFWLFCAMAISIGGPIVPSFAYLHRKNIVLLKKKGSK